MDDLSDDDLVAALALCRADSVLFLLGTEVIRHRTAKRADAEWVKAVVRRVCNDVLLPIGVRSTPFVADDIAARVAEQLANAVVVLSKEERKIALRLKADEFTPEHDIGDGCATCDRRRATHAFLDRLLGATC